MSKHELPAEEIHPSTKRAKEIDANPPYEELKAHVENESKKEQGTGGKNVIHWFRNQDLRIHDNNALHAASQSAKEHGKTLICIYMYCLEEMEWHGVGSARLDFLLRNFECLKQELGKLDIPFAMLSVEKRSDIVPKLAGFVEEHDAQRVFANFEYEIDEVRRDITVMETVSEGNWSFELRHDQTIMEPGMLATRWVISIPICFEVIQLGNDIDDCWRFVLFKTKTRKTYRNRTHVRCRDTSIKNWLTCINVALANL